ncbi:hypothetical protein SEA_MUFASA8_34 [Arthrobacter phage Mufasa8]|uniref:Uncharacterized protein n=1 Tax=Arthrobacter phage Mufasa8 TaxID=2656526 RepID=A0A649VP93_9CAUD|nr:hypothetical protein HYQ08_gp034 [Arthrobacter phage Mufasa8]QGJ93483.1 hypothetical protein SEA_MUFASA8_34 [Arthrobacter phage Mufasa8]
MNITNETTITSTITVRKIEIADGPLVKTKLHEYTKGTFRVESVEYSRIDGAEPTGVTLRGPRFNEDGSPDTKQTDGVLTVKWEKPFTGELAFLNELVD